MTQMTIPAAVMHHFLGLPEACKITSDVTVTIDFAAIPDDKPSVRPAFRRVGNGASTTLVFAGFKAIDP